LTCTESTCVSRLAGQGAFNHLPADRFKPLDPVSFDNCRDYIRHFLWRQFILTHCIKRNELDQIRELFSGLSCGFRGCFRSIQFTNVWFLEKIQMAQAYFSKLFCLIGDTRRFMPDASSPITIQWLSLANSELTEAESRAGSAALSRRMNTFPGQLAPFWNLKNRD